MEEQQERRNVEEKEGDQPSRNSGQTGPEPKEHRTSIVEMSDKVMKNWIQSLQKAKERTQSQTQWPRIPRVPQILRWTQDFNKFYEPRVISFGPYHHSKPDLHPEEMIKPLYAEQFLADSNQDIKDLYTKIGSNIKAVRDCYDSNSTKEYDDEALAWMMLLDGCSLLQIIRETDTSNVLAYHQRCLVKLDLFLLENQLPFGVLKLIFEGAKFNDGPSMEEKIKKFVTDTGRPTGIQLEEENEEPSHLLDLFRSALLGRFKMIRSRQPEQEQQPEKKGKSSSRQGEDRGSCCPWKKGIWKSFRNIKELKAAGIHLQLNRTSSLRDISFNSHFFYGCLKLPPIIIDGFTKPKFLNLVAYEMCPEAPNDYAVTSYISFLYELIDHADDVKELRSNHILYNCLGSDEEVAKIFNEITNDFVNPDAYGDVKARIQEHYDKRVNTWMAQALHDHFSTPWTIMAFIGAVLVLFLTAVQTYCALPGN
ncbi:hypothetical protein VitviT2T_020990 [Vitis vinifera]|uniref:UPF0481 protein n=2 Tax=Vitis vinifera TaxID=29760 RepID=A0A438FKG0_VITVI|nr:UPF0481 protein At3g47200-like [Vitis vinifera]RVW60508.1 UPF0481 protein [Vitis vinifera]RVW83058.1 UPF0481 protein [Vitis vinifera]WKA02837.1 hypothetical protein VitviT2T_020990 [Vitis vinifera]|eukprot:XP_010659620.1 PREDICTED: UPF0481 protein At3g47200-like [Vitis vinifera]